MSASDRQRAVATMLHCIAEGLAEGRWSNFTFHAKQSHKEKRSVVGNRLLDRTPNHISVTFTLDVLESEFAEDIERRKREIGAALRLEIDKGIVAELGLPAVEDLNSNYRQSQLMKPLCAHCLSPEHRMSDCPYSGLRG